MFQRVFPLLMAKLQYNRNKSNISNNFSIKHKKTYNCALVKLSNVKYFCHLPFLLNSQRVAITFPLNPISMLQSTSDDNGWLHGIQYLQRVLPFEKFSNATVNCKFVMYFRYVHVGVVLYVVILHSAFLLLFIPF